MLPSIVNRRLQIAEAVAQNLRATAIENPDKPALAQRFLQAAQTIDETVALCRLANWTAKLNHDTIADMAARRAL